MRNHKKMKGKIYLIPNLLGECDPSLVIPEGVVKVIHTIRHFIVEDIRSARRYLIKLKHPLRPDDLSFYELDKYKPEKGLEKYIHLCLSGYDIGIISEAGMPGIADPGSLLVKAGHVSEVMVVPLTGPSSLFLALSASGLNGQNFVFHGYLPKKTDMRMRKIKEIETLSVKNMQTQIFMETPYRNMNLIDDLLKYCKPTTLLCIACDISTKNEFIRTSSISGWSKNKPGIHKRPCIFLLEGN